MILIFRYGEEISSTATVEASFKKLKKTLIFKNIDLPTNMRVFMDNHIPALNGSTILHTTRHQTNLLNWKIFIKHMIFCVYQQKSKFVKIKPHR